MERVIAEGGMSSVYLALQESLGRSVAVKVLEKTGGRQDARRFLREARIIASLKHRNIITIHDVGAVGGRYYIAMEYLEGGSLADKIAEGMSPNQALDLVEGIASCLDFVHRRGILHGDIKPANILFDRDGTPKLSDFGIAERGEEGHRRAQKNGKIYCSPHYLSPEQADGLPRDGRSDIYGLGIVLHQMLTGRMPYEADSDVAIIIAHLSSPIPLLPEPLSGCQRLLEKMIAKRPADRVRDAGELLKQIPEARALMTRRGRLIDAVSRLLPAKPMPRRVPWPTGIRMRSVAPPVFVAGALLVLVLGLVGVSHQGPTDRAEMAGAVAAAPESGDPQASEHASKPGRPAATTRTAESPPPPELVSNEASADSGLFTPPSPEPAGQHAAVLARDEPVDDSVEIVEAKDDAPPPTSDASPPAPTPHQPKPDSAAPPVAELPAAAEDGEKIAGWIEDAERALAANRLTTPTDDNAYDRYRQVLDLAPDHPTARAGLSRIAERYATLGRGALAGNRPSLARLYLRRGTAVRDDHPALRRLGEELEATDRRVADDSPRVDPPNAEAAGSTAVRETPFDFEKVGDPGRGQEGTGNIVKDFKDAWRSLFD